MKDAGAGVGDFERKLRATAQTLGEPALLWQRLDALGIARVERTDIARTASEAGREELPEFPPESDPPEPPRVAPMPAEMRRTVADLAAMGAAIAGISLTSTPVEVATAVEATLRRAHRESPLTSKEIASLGALWGDAIAQSSGWAWAELIRGESEQACLASSDHAYACLPFALIEAQANSTRETTALLVFNMIQAGKLPDSRAGRLTLIG